MVESGDWIVPRLLDEPFLDKPILYFWAIAASLKIFGMSEAAVRLPGLLFGMLGTLTTAAVAWRMLGRRTGLIAGVFYASMILPLALVQLPAHDVALVPWVNLALLCFWESDRGDSPRRAWAWTAAAGVVLGLAILTKGLAGVALVGIAYGGYLIVSRRLRFIHCFRAALALTVAAIIGSSWYLAVEHANPGYLRYYFFERHVLGFLTKSQPHGLEPWWYYFPVLIIGGIPWVGYLPVLVQDAVSRWRNRTPAVTDARGNRPLLLLGCWFVGCTLFLTVSRSKLVHVYLAGLSGDGDPGGDRLGEEDRRRAFRRRQALDGPDRLVYLPDWPVGPAGHFRHHADRAADAVLAAGLDAGGRGGADFPGAALELVARPGSLDAGAGGNDRLRSNGRSAVVRLSPGCRGAFRPRFGRLFQSHAGIAVADADGPGADRLGRFLSRSRLAQPVATRPDGEPGHRRPPALARAGHEGMDRRSRASSAYGVATTTIFRRCLTSGPAASGSIGAATWSRGADRA